MFNWLLGRKRKPSAYEKSIETIKQRILSDANHEMQRGVPRQVICDLLLKHPKKASLEEAQAYSQAQRELTHVMVDRNLKGKQLEKAGKENQAIHLYEDNLRDGFSGTHPYTRLRIIYTKRKDHGNAIRVCQAFIDLPPNGRPMNKAPFRKHLKKLQALIA